MDLEKLKYPIGKFEVPAIVDEPQLKAWIADIEALPGLLNQAVAGLTDTQLDTTYRPGGWTLRQVVHHLADSHLNAYVRFKLAITENHPHIRPYDEAQWARCEDGLHAPVVFSLELLVQIHRRWVYFMKSLQPADFKRTYFHPEHQKSFELQYLCGLYAWHGAHHLAHINQTRQREGWL